jgi:alpha-L-fucosidase
MHTLKHLPRIAKLAASVFVCQPTMAQWSHREGAPAPKVASHLVQPFTLTEWDESHFADEKDHQWFRDAKYGMFIHFGLSTYAKKELSWGICTPKPPDVGQGAVPDKVWQGWQNEFRIEKFDAKEWVATAQAAGFKYLVAIAKHSEGFHLWDTAFSDFKVTHTPFGHDYLKELADACHAAKMPFGIYYCQRDWYHPDYMPVDPGKVTRKGTNWKLNPGETSPLGEGHRKYIDYQFNVVRELCTKYGKLDIFWWDAAWWGGMFTPEMWDSEKLTRMVRELQPGILQNNRCSVPGDFDTPEQQLGLYQDWRAWESCMCLEDTWSYSGGAPKSRDTVIGMIVHNACRDGNLLLSWGPKWDGEFAATQKQRLLEVGGWLKKNGRAIYRTRGGPWKPATWGGSTRRGKTVWLHITGLKEEILELPAIRGRSIMTARLLNGENITFRQTGDTLTINVPHHIRTTPDTIVELSCDKAVDGLSAIESGAVSAFDDSVTFGHIISRQATVKASSVQSGDPKALVAQHPAADFAFATKPELNPWIEIDLGRDVSVTAVRLLNHAVAAPAETDAAAIPGLSVSSDGKTWTEVWKAGRAAPRWDIPVTEFKAGVNVPGRNARHLRLETKSDQPHRLKLRQVEVWGKDDRRTQEIRSDKPYGKPG